MLRNLALVTCFVLSCLAFGSEGEVPLLNEPPKDVSVPSIIQSFAAKEKEFKQAREHYAYTQEVTVRASCQGEQPGVYHLVVDVMLDGKGNRVEKVKTVDSTLQCISITKEDLEGFRNQSLFLVTTDEIPDYQIKFIGQQQQDEPTFLRVRRLARQHTSGQAAVRGSHLGE
jgi:hypothetical protein